METGVAASSGDQFCVESRLAQPRLRSKSWYVSPRPGSCATDIRPSTTVTSFGATALSGDPGSVTDNRIILSRNMFPTVNTADPTLAMVREPECDGAFGYRLSPSAKRTRSTGSPSASAATWL